LGVPASKVAYELTFGAVPDGLVVRHTCDRPDCCNPAHLIAGTKRDNFRDMEQRRRIFRMRGRFASTIYHRVPA
jgi:HNH endonuclease